MYRNGINFSMRYPANTGVPRDSKFAVPQIPKLKIGCGIGNPNVIAYLWYNWHHNSPSSPELLVAATHETSPSEIFTSKVGGILGWAILWWPNICMGKSGVLLCAT